MVIITNRWSPDTCLCVFEYTWDNAVPAESRVHTLSKVVNTCTSHSGLSGTILYTRILKENFTKNTLRQEIIDTIPRLTEKVAAVGGTIDKLNVPYNWSFSGNDDTRTLTVTVAELTDGEKTTLQSSADGKSEFSTVLVKNG